MINSSIFNSVTKSVISRVFVFSMGYYVGLMQYTHLHSFFVQKPCYTRTNTLHVQIIVKDIIAYCKSHFQIIHTFSDWSNHQSGFIFLKVIHPWELLFLFFSLCLNSKHLFLSFSLVKKLHHLYFCSFTLNGIYQKTILSSTSQKVEEKR